MVLRQLIFLVEYSQVPSFLLHQEEFTIMSPFFCEVVLQISKLPQISSEDRTPTEFIFGRQFAERKDFRLVIKTCELIEQEPFQRLMEETFWLFMEKGRVHFETDQTVDSIHIGKSSWIS